jgi:hypothetical protein
LLSKIMVLMIYKLYCLKYRFSGFDDIHVLRF